jgi:hypothetical protein
MKLNISISFCWCFLSMALARADFSITNFASSPVAITKSGSAEVTGAALALVSGASENGSAFAVNPIDMDQFNITFQVQVTVPTFSLGPADGFAFVIQGTTPFALGNLYGCLGESNSLAIIFADFGINEILIQNGDATTPMDYFNNFMPGQNYADGLVHTITLQYAVGVLRIALDQTNLLFLQINLSTNLALTGGKGYVGFSASSRSSYYATHEITRWDYQHVATNAALGLSPIHDLTLYDGTTAVVPFSIICNTNLPADLKVFCASTFPGENDWPVTDPLVIAEAVTINGTGTNRIATFIPRRWMPQSFSVPDYTTVMMCAESPANNAVAYSSFYLQVIPRAPFGLQITRADAQNNVLDFTGNADMSYTLQYRDSPVSGPWLNLTNIGPLDSYGQVNISNNISGVPRRFYRLASPEIP